MSPEGRFPACWGLLAAGGLCALTGRYKAAGGLLAMGGLGFFILAWDRATGNDLRRIGDLYRYRVGLGEVLTHGALAWLGIRLMRGHWNVRSAGTWDADTAPSTAASGASAKTLSTRASK